MDYKHQFNRKGLSIGYLALAIALNFFWTLGLAVFVTLLWMQEVQGGSAIIQAVMVAVTLIGPFLIGWWVGNWAADTRALAYGVYGSLGSVIVLVFTALPTGLLGLMLIAAALAGGLNGGLFSMRRRFKQSKTTK